MVANSREISDLKIYIHMRVCATESHSSRISVLTTGYGKGVGCKQALLLKMARGRNIGAK